MPTAPETNGVGSGRELGESVHRKFLQNYILNGAVGFFYHTNNQIRFKIFILTFIISTNIK